MRLAALSRFSSAIWLLVLLAGLFIIGPASPADQPVEAWGVAGVGLVFIGSTALVLRWGRFLSAFLPMLREESPSWLAATALGTVWIFALSWALGVTGLLGSSWAWIWVLALGASVFLPVTAKLPILPSGWRASEKTMLGLIVAAVFFRLLQALELQPHGDVFNYHLLTPRLWFDRGGIHMPEGLPLALYAGAWDQLYLMATALFPGPPGHGFSEAHYYAQWFHLVFGYGGSLLASFAILRTLGTGRFWSLAGTLAVASIASLRHMSIIAKNDWGAVFWALTGLYFWIRALMGGKSGAAGVALLGGVFAGLAFTAKMTTLFALVPALVVAFLLRPSARAAAFGVIGGLLGAGPILLRNVVFTGNPLFPTLNRIFPSEWLSTSNDAYFKAYEGGGWPDAGEWLRRFQEVLSETPLNALVFAAVVASVALLIGRRRIPLRFAPVPVAIAAWFLFVLGAGHSAEMRLFGPGLVLWALAGAAGLDWGLERFAGPRARKIAAVAGAVVILALSNVPAHMIAKFFKRGVIPARESVATFACAGSKAWLRSHLAAGERLLVSGDPELFYLSAFDLVNLDWHPQWDRELHEREDFKEPAAVLGEIRRRWPEAKYLFLRRGSGTAPDRGHVTQRLELYLRKNPGLVAFDDGHSRVVRLRD